MAARRKLGFVIADISQQQWVQQRAAGKPFGAVSDCTGLMGPALEAERAPKMTAAESASPVKMRAQVELKVAS